MGEWFAALAAAEPSRDSLAVVVHYVGIAKLMVLLE
jgi:hypothetical protein